MIVEILIALFVLLILCSILFGEPPQSDAHLSNKSEDEEDWDDSDS